MNKKHKMIEEANLSLIVLNYYIIIFKEQTLEEPNHTLCLLIGKQVKKQTINPKIEKDNECFKWLIISGLSYTKIKEKELKKRLKLKSLDTDFSQYQRDWEEDEQNNTSIALNVLFVSRNNEEINFAYKQNCNKCKNQVILIMINDENNNSYYFAVKYKDGENLKEIIRQLHVMYYIYHTIQKQ